MSANKKLSRSKKLRNTTHLIFIFFLKIKKFKKRKQKKLNHDNCSLTRCTLFFICAPNFFICTPNTVYVYTDLIEKKVLDQPSSIESSI